MKNVAIVALALQFFVLSAFAAEATRECSLCTGAVSRLDTTPATPVPLLVQVALTDLSTSAAPIDALSTAQRAKLTLLVRYTVATTGDPLIDVENETKAIVDWAKQHGPFDAIGVDVVAPNTDVAAYAVKRLAVTAQGQNVASRIVLSATSTEDLTKLNTAGAMAYVDALVVDAASVEKMAAWLAENDPAKKIYAVVTAESPNAVYDLAAAFSKGATRAYLSAATADDLNAIASFIRAFIGDYAYDSTA